MCFPSKVCVVDQFEFSACDFFPGDIIFWDAGISCHNLMIRDVGNWSAGCDHDTPNGFSKTKVQAISLIVCKEGVTAL